LRDEVASLPGTNVVVTDNASGDDSVERLESTVRDNGWGKWVTIQPLQRNGGFAAGNNAAIVPALAAEDPPRFVLLLNPDTIVRPGLIRTRTSSVLESSVNWSAVDARRGLAFSPWALASR